TERDIKHNQVQPYSLSYLNFLDWSAAQHSFSDLALFRAAGIYKIIGRDRTLANFRMVSWNFLSLLGARPIVGRGFTADDDRPGAMPTVILSYAGWLKLFGPQRSGQVSVIQSTNLLGETLRFNGLSYNVIGVLPRE